MSVNSLLTTLGLAMTTAADLIGQTIHRECDRCVGSEGIVESFVLGSVDEARHELAADDEDDDDDCDGERPGVAEDRVPEQGEVGHIRLRK